MDDQIVPDPHDESPVAEFIEEAPADGRLRRKVNKAVRRLRGAVRDLADCAVEMRRIRAVFGEEFPATIDRLIESANQALVEIVEPGAPAAEPGGKKTVTLARNQARLALGDFEDAFENYRAALKDIEAARETSREIAARGKRAGRDHIDPESVFEFLKKGAQATTGE